VQVRVGKQRVLHPTSKGGSMARILCMGFHKPSRRVLQGEQPLRKGCAKIADGNHRDNTVMEVHSQNGYC
jgi:hypothetical protein